jgi:hypothetical protein
VDERDDLGGCQSTFYSPSARSDSSTTTTLANYPFRVKLGFVMQSASSNASVCRYAISREWNVWGARSRRVAVPVLRPCRRALIVLKSFEQVRHEDQSIQIARSLCRLDRF